MEDKREKYILFGANCIVDWIKEHNFYDIQGLNENKYGIGKSYIHYNLNIFSYICIGGLINFYRYAL